MELSNDSSAWDSLSLIPQIYMVEGKDRPLQAVLRAPQAHPGTQALPSTGIYVGKEIGKILFIWTFLLLKK